MEKLKPNFSNSVKKKWQNWVKKVKQRGSERLTIMIVPHNEAHIFSLQVSKFAILYAVLIVLTILITSGFSVKLQQNIKEEAQELYLTETALSEEREQYMRHYRRLRKLHEQFREELQSLAHFAELHHEEGYFFRGENHLHQLSQESLEKEAQALLQNLKSSEKPQQFLIINPKITADGKIPEKLSYGSEARQFRKIHLSLKDTIALARSFHNFVKEREEVQKSLPYFWPIAGGHFTSFYGPRISPFGYARDFHTGIDLADEIGTPVYAAADGYVTSSGYNGAYGIHIRIQHRFGYQTVYAHLSVSVVSPGQAVKKGQMIGRVGSTGRSTGPHLHYEVRLMDRHLDPLPYLTSL